MPGLPEVKRSLLELNLEPEEIGVAGFFLIMVGACAGNEPLICVPAVTIGLSLMAYSTREMEGRAQEFSPPQSHF